MIQISTKTRIVVALLAVWLVISALIICRLQAVGAYASVCTTKTLDFIRDVGHADPASVRLNQSYSQWATALNMLDPSNYIKVGLGFAEGKGVSLKNITPEDPDSKNYLAYYFQAPGTPIVIGTMIKLFGEKCIVPYFILVCVLHFITALLACQLASKFVEENMAIFGVGVITLLCLPVLDFNFAVGLFSSEPLAAPCLGIALIALSHFWRDLREHCCSYQSISVDAIVCGIALGCASYFRDIYTTFAYFSFAILVLIGVFKPNKLREIALFVLISVIALSAIEYPWEKRNQHYFNEFTMSGSTYCGYSLWHQVWSDYKELSRWSWDAGMGVGHYLAPEKSVEVLSLLAKDKQAGNKYAWKSFIELICQHPWEVISYKLKVYDTLWFGQRCHWLIYLWCVCSTLSFFVFIWFTRFKFFPELYLFPLFILCISPVMHYEHRYVQPFFLFITPITAIYVIQTLRQKGCRFPSFGNGSM